MSNDAVIIVLDVGKSMGTRSIQCFEEAKKIVSRFIQMKIQHSPKDLVSLLLVGSSKSHNHLNESNEEEYQNIEVVQQLGPPSITLLKTIDAIDCKTNGGKQSDVFESIVVAADMLAQYGVKKTFKKRIFIITDGGGVQFDADVITVLSAIQASDTKIDVIGVEFDKELYDLIDTTDTKGDIRIPNESKLTPKKINEIYFYNICERTGGIVIHSDEAMATMNPLRSKQKVPRATFTFPMEVAPGLLIPIRMFKKSEPVKIPAPEKMSKISADSLEDGTMKIKRQATYYSVDNPDEEVDVDKRVKAFRFGKNYIPVSSTDEESMKYTTEKCFQILGFCDQAAIPRHHFMGSTYCVVAKDGDKDADLALTCLIRALAQLDQAALVRYAYRAGNTVHLGCLHPVIKPDYECLYFNTLPFSDDLRPFTFKSLNDVDVSSEQLQAAEDLIKSMNLMEADTDVQGNKIEALKPKEVYDPMLKYHAACVHHRALYPNDPLPSIDPLIIKHCLPERSENSFYTNLIKKSEQVFSNFAKQFPLKRIEKSTVLGKRKYWFAMDDQNQVTLDSYNNPETVNSGEAIAQQLKKKRLEADGNDDNDPISNPLAFQNLFNDKADDVGTTDPVKDFNEMFNRRDVDLVDKAISQMQAIVQKLIKESIEDQYYQKCYDCLVSLRRGCIKEEESEKFNSFLRELKRQHSSSSSRRHDFWKNYVVGNKLTLISSEEADDVDNVSAQEAKDFLLKELIPVQEESVEPPKLSGDEEDLFGDLE